MLQNQHALGISIEDGKKRFALLGRFKGKVEVLEVGEEVFPSVTFKERGAFLGKRRLPLTCALATKDVLFRRFPLAVKSYHQLMKSLPFQLETRLPYPLDQAMVAIEPIKGKEVLIYATQKNRMEEALTSWKTYKLEPDHVACTSAALVAFCNLFFPDRPEITFLWLSKNEGCMGSLKERSCVNAFPFIDLPRHLAVLPPASPILLLGSFSPTLRDAVEKHGHPVLTVESKLAAFALPIGLASLTLTQPIDLRYGPFLSRLNLRRRLLPRVLALSAAALLLVTTGAACMTALNWKEEGIAAELSGVLKKPISRNELQAVVEEWEDALADTKNLGLQAPRVSDLLAFLSTHPLLNEHGIDVRRFRYALTPPKVEIELAAPSTRIQAIREALSAEKRFVEKGVTLEQLQESYVLSFALPRGKA